MEDMQTILSKKYLFRKTTVSRTLQAKNQV